MFKPSVNVINGSDKESRYVSSSGIKHEVKPHRFLQNWSKSNENLMSGWADICTVYKWLHDRSEKSFHISNLCISLPTIILSTLTGTANFAIQSITGDNENIQKFASFGIGTVSILVSILSTIGSYLRYAPLEEAHRVASISWSKFGRQISVELALHPDDRMDAMDFLKICRAELDRLIEQSPLIPDSIIKEFQCKFGHIKDLKRPEICGNLEHTAIYQSSESRLKKLMADTALMLKHKANTLKELVTPEMEARIKKQVDQRLESALEERKKKLEAEIEERRKFASEEEMERSKLMEERRDKLQKELEIEKERLQEELEQERKKAREQEETLIHLAEERRKKIEAEMDLEKQSVWGSARPKYECLNTSSFENRININRLARETSSLSSSVTPTGHSHRRKSIINDQIYVLETGIKGTISVSTPHTYISSDTGNHEKKSEINEIVITDK